jgi:hypothetical protein
VRWIASPSGTAGEKSRLVEQGHDLGLPDRLAVEPLDRQALLARGANV